MKRLTTRNKSKVKSTAEEKGATEKQTDESLWERLMAYEDYHEDLLKRRDEIPMAMKELKDQGKEKSYRYRELMGEKLLVENVLGTLTRYL